MDRLLVALAILVMAVSLAGCGGSSTKASRDCFDVWNDGSNKAERSRVMGRFGVANVAEWRAEAANGTAKVEWRAGPSGASVTVNRGGPGNKGCGYLFHTSKRFLSISAEWKGKEIRWDVPPPIRGPWTMQQRTYDNATVAADGRLIRRH